MFRRRQSYNLQNGNISETIQQHGPEPPFDANLNKESIENSRGYAISLKSFEGLLYTVSGSFLMSLNYVFAKRLFYISPGEQSMIYSCGNVIFNLPIIFYNLRDILAISRQDALLITFRAVFVVLAMYAQLMTYRYLPLAEAAIIMSTVPSTTSACAYFFLKEPCSFAQVVALILTAIGMLVSIRIPELLKNRSAVELDSDYTLGLASGVASVFIVTFAYVSIRKMKKVHVSVIALYSGGVGIVLNAVITGTFESFSLPRCGWDTFETALIGVFGYLGNMLMIVAFQKDIAGVVAVVQCAANIIFAMIFQKIFFSQVPDMYVSVGATLVIVSILIVAVRSWLLTVPDTSSIRKNLRCICS